MSMSLSYSSSSSGANQCLPPATQKLLMKELAGLQNSPPDGVRVANSDLTVLTSVDVHIDGPVDTPYSGGLFLVRISVDAEYPRSAPQARFLTRLFHPNVAPVSGAVCVNTLQKDWRANLGLAHVLLTIKCLLIEPNAESALNEEAGRLLLEHYSEYWRRAQMMTHIHAQSALCSSVQSVNVHNDVDNSSAISSSVTASSSSANSTCNAVLCSNNSVIASNNITNTNNNNRRRNLKRL